MSNYSPILGRSGPGGSGSDIIGSVSEPLLGISHKRHSHTRHTWLDPVRKRSLLRSLSDDLIPARRELRGRYELP
jgi:hypothetical protein